MAISQNNLTKRPHRRRTWSVQYIRHSPGGANVHAHLAYVFFGPPKSYPTVISIGSAVFAPVTQCRESLYFPLKIAP